MVTTARINPTVADPTMNPLQDGFSTLLAFAADPDINFWEVTVTPPGIDGGEPIDQTTMHNETYGTLAPQSLVMLTGGQAEGAYDSSLYTSILALVNENGWITIHFPDGSTYDFVGYLKSFAPGALAKGGQPRASFAFVCTNQLDGVETDPEYNAGP